MKWLIKLIDERIKNYMQETNRYSFKKHMLCLLDPEISKTIDSKTYKRAAEGYWYPCD